MNPTGKSISAFISIGIVKTFLAFSLTAIFNCISFAQPCSCNHTITNEQTGVNGATLNVQPGDTVCIMAGSRDYLYLSNFHGDSLHYIVFINCGGSVTVQNNYYMYGIKFSNSTYFRFTGSGVDSVKYGIKVLESAPGCNGLSLDDKSSNFEIDHLEIANTGFAGIVSKTEPRCDLTTNRGFFTQYQTVFHDNYIHNTGGEGFYIGHSFYTGYAVTCNGLPDTLYPHEIKGVRVYNNIVENAHWDGIQVSCVTEDCEIYGNTVTGYGASAVSSQNNGIQMGGGTTGKCYNNFISNGTGNGIVVFGTGNNLIFNNVIVNAGLNFYPNDPAKRIHGIFCDDRATVPGRYFNFVNNTIVHPKTDGIRFSSLESTNNQILNNIIIHPGSLGSYSTNSQSFINLLPGVDVTLSNNYTELFMSGIQFRDTLADNFRLLNNSPARDTGTDVSPMEIIFDHDNLSRPYAAGFDIGAFEHNPDNVWTGTLSSSWEVAGNWSKKDIPLPEENVIIPGGTLHPLEVTSTGIVCNHLLIGPGASLLLFPTASITVSGNLTIQPGGTMENHGVLNMKGNLINLNP